MRNVRIFRMAAALVFFAGFAVAHPLVNVIVNGAPPVKNRSTAVRWFIDSTLVTSQNAPFNTP